MRLTGQASERAGHLARELIATIALGGASGWEAALEPFLTEMANDRALGALTVIRLAQVAAAATAELAELELGEGPDDEAVAGRAMMVVDELLAMAGA